MVSSLKIKQYRKLKDVEIKFSEGVNIISGTNGTCKTSILQMISNSFQQVNKPLYTGNDINSVTQINRLNDNVNQKIERLTKGDEMYNDPAPNNKGTLYTVEYNKDKCINFRKHNTRTISRYAIKPQYNVKGESLPSIPVIYLGLSRLYPIGEFHSDDVITNVRTNLPNQYVSEIKNMYKDLTNIDITFEKYVTLGEVRKKMVFKTCSNGVDSNTISSGEDNLLSILVAISTLKYYCSTLPNLNETSAILIVDEIDATLHPSLQNEILRLLYTLSVNYNIQMFFTTHSLSFLKSSQDLDCNIIYLMETNKIELLDEPDYYKIELYLKNVTKSKYESDTKIPVFTEDAEARLLTERILQYFDSIDENTDFFKIGKTLHFVDANIGCESLKSIFSDNYVRQTSLSSICIVDGDVTDIDNPKYKSIIKLPGKLSPEKMLFEFASHILDPSVCEEYEDGTLEGFWLFPPARSEAITKRTVQDICNEIEKRTGGSDKSTREFDKKIFNNNKTFFTVLYDYWLTLPENQVLIKSFHDSLYNQYNKVSRINEVGYDLWKQKHSFSTE